MNFEFLAGSLVSLGIFAFLTFSFVKSYPDERARKVLIPAFFIGVAQLMISAFSLLWFFGALKYAQGDFLLIYSTLLLIQGFFVFLIVYNISRRDNNLFYLLLIYLIVFLVVAFLHASFATVFIAAYFLLVLLLSLSLLFREDSYRDIGIFGIFYSGISLLLHVFVLLDIASVYLFSIFYNVLLLVFVFFLVKYLLENPIPLPRVLRKKRSYLFIFMRNFIFMVALINLVFIGTIVIHEFGHLGVSEFYNCASREIVYNAGFPETQILCSDLRSNLYVSLGGPILPVLIGLILILVSGRFLKEIGLLMIGFNLIVSSQDFTAIGLSQNISIFIVFLGIAFAVAGIVILAKSRTEDYLYSIGQFE